MFTFLPQISQTTEEEAELAEALDFEEERPSRRRSVFTDSSLAHSICKCDNAVSTRPERLHKRSVTGTHQMRYVVVEIEGRLTLGTVRLLPRMADPEVVEQFFRLGKRVLHRHAVTWTSVAGKLQILSNPCPQHKLCPFLPVYEVLLELVDLQGERHALGERPTADVAGNPAAGN